MSIPIATAATLIGLPWDELITDQAQIGCREISRQFDVSLLETEEQKQSLKLISRILEMCTSYETPAEPYRPMFIDQNGRSLIPDDLNGDQTTELVDFAPNIQNPCVRGRIADVAWINNRSQRKMAELAIDSYCTRIEQCLDGSASFKGTRKSDIDFRVLTS